MSMPASRNRPKPRSPLGSLLPPIRAAAPATRGQEADVPILATEHAWV
ncbi:unnamed protein product [Ectocarpus sp. 12 AP-2014]